MINKKIHLRLKAFSLIEISIVLIIIGLITTAVFKGQDLIESARAQATLDDLNQIRLSILSYRDQYGQWPGNDSKAQLHFGNQVINGDGRGIIHGSECAQVWHHLKAASFMDSSQAPICRLGGYIIVISSPTSQLAGNWLAISGVTDILSSALTPKQAMVLKAKAGETKPTEGHIIVQAPPGQPASDCHNGHTFNLLNKSPACIALIKL